MKIRTPSASGITLIELLVVMSLLALLAAFVAPNVGAGLDNLTLRSTGRQVVSILRQTQSEARMRQESLAVRVQTGSVTLVSDSQPQTIDLNRTVQIGDGEPSTYILLGSGQIVGPERLALENERGRRVDLVLGIGTVNLVEEGL